MNPGAARGRLCRWRPPDIGQPMSPGAARYHRSWCPGEGIFITSGGDRRPRSRNCSRWLHRVAILEPQRCMRSARRRKATASPTASPGRIHSVSGHQCAPHARARHRARDGESHLIARRRNADDYAHHGATIEQPKFRLCDTRTPEEATQGSPTDVEPVKGPRRAEAGIGRPAWQACVSTRTRPGVAPRNSQGPSPESERGASPGRSMRTR